MRSTFSFSGIFCGATLLLVGVLDLVRWRVCHTVWGLEEGKIANLCLALFIAMHCQCSSIHLLSVHWFVWSKDTGLTGFTGDMTVHWILETGKGEVVVGRLCLKTFFYLACSVIDGSSVQPTPAQERYLWCKKASTVCIWQPFEKNQSQERGYLGLCSYWTDMKPFRFYTPHKCTLKILWCVFFTWIVSHCINDFHLNLLLSQSHLHKDDLAQPKTLFSVLFDTSKR